MQFINENPLLTKEDLERCLLDLLSPLENYTAGSGYDLGHTHAHYSPQIALMEGWCRTLWGIGPLIAGGGAFPAVGRYLSVLRGGVNPASPHFWGYCNNCDQRLVEMASIALCLIIAKETFWDSLNKDEQGQLYNWLSAIETVELPCCNWHFFRIMVCLAFRRLGLPVNEQAEQESFDLIESFYRGDGWYADGPDGMYDLYNPMGFHYYGLIYAKFAVNYAPERAARYIERAKLFAPRYAQWFRDDGSVIPYGRSLTYRFAAHSFFSACAFAGVEAVPWGIMKRILLQGLRRWFSLPILDNGGILSIGYGYPNLIMADTYNSPGSPYWGLKAFLALALEPEHPFWQARETPLPQEPEITAEAIPGFIISRNGEDAQLLCAGRKHHYDVNHAAHKYCKFVYSARFGFCVAHGSGSLEQAGCDSMLMLAEEGNGSPEYWRERRDAEDIRSGPNWVSSVWRPWPDIKIETTLASLGLWHLRIHRIESGRKLKTAEGGFSLKRYHQFDEALPVSNAAAHRSEALAAFPWGASRIAALEAGAGRTGTLVFPAPNLNILEASGVIPVLAGTINEGVTILKTAVCAGSYDTVTQAALPDPPDNPAKS